MFYQGPLSSKQSIKTIKLKNWRALMENFHGIPGLLRYPDWQKYLMTIPGTSGIPDS